MLSFFYDTAQFRIEVTQQNYLLFGFWSEQRLIPGLLSLPNRCSKSTLTVGASLESAVIRSGRPLSQLSQRESKNSRLIFCSEISWAQISIVQPATKSTPFLHLKSENMKIEILNQRPHAIQTMQIFSVSLVQFIPPLWTQVNWLQN